MKITAKQSSKLDELFIVIIAVGLGFAAIIVILIIFIKYYKTRSFDLYEERPNQPNIHRDSFIEVIKDCILKIFPKKQKIIDQNCSNEYINECISQHNICSQHNNISNKTGILQNPDDPLSSANNSLSSNSIASLSEKSNTTYSDLTTNNFYYNITDNNITDKYNSKLEIFNCEYNDEENLINNYYKFPCCKSYYSNNYPNDTDYEILCKSYGNLIPKIFSMPKLYEQIIYINSTIVNFSGIILCYHIEICFNCSPDLEQFVMYNNSENSQRFISPFNQILMNEINIYFKPIIYLSSKSFVNFPINNFFDINLCEIKPQLSKSVYNQNFRIDDRGWKGRSRKILKLNIY